MRCPRNRRQQTVATVPVLPTARRGHRVFWCWSRGRQVAVHAPDAWCAGSRSSSPGDRDLQGYLAQKQTPTPLDPPWGRRHGPTLGSLGDAFAYERGTPVGTWGVVPVPPASRRRCRRLSCCSVGGGNLLLPLHTAASVAREIRFWIQVPYG